jgi:hypothetical protein
MERVPEHVGRLRRPDVNQAKCRPICMHDLEKERSTTYASLCHLHTIYDSNIYAPSQAEGDSANAPDGSYSAI